jgi:hypothetical protein
MTRDLCPSLVVVLALAVPGSALAQVTSTDLLVAPPVQVERLAPQLQTFAGSPGNFSSLVSGLAQGSQVTLTSTASDGFTEVVTFTPSGTMTATAVAQTLETARQNLIARGIATPSASQLAAALLGGTVQTTSGPVSLTGLLPTTPVSTTTLNSTVPNTALANGTNALNTRSLNAGVVTAPDGSVIGPLLPRVNTSDSPFPRNTSDSPARGLNAPANTLIAPGLVATPLTPSTPPALTNNAAAGGTPGGFIVRPRR